MSKPPRPQRPDRIRAWILIILGILMLLAGAGFALNRFMALDIFPIALGIALILIGYRFLNRKRVFKVDNT